MRSYMTMRVCARDIFRYIRSGSRSFCVCFENVYILLLSVCRYE